MTAKEYLKQVYLLDKRIDSDIEEVTELRALAEKVTVPMGNERVQTSRTGEAPFTRALEQIWTLEQEIDEEIDRLVDTKRQIRKRIDKLEDFDHRMILRYRYIHCCSWNEISEKMSISLRWAYILHGKALQAMETVLQAIEGENEK